MFNEHPLLYLPNLQVHGAYKLISSLRAKFSIERHCYCYTLGQINGISNNFVHSYFVFFVGDLKYSGEIKSNLPD